MPAVDDDLVQLVFSVFVARTCSDQVNLWYHPASCFSLYDIPESVAQHLYHQPAKPSAKSKDQLPLSRVAYHAHLPGTAHKGLRVLAAQRQTT